MDLSGKLMVMFTILQIRPTVFSYLLQQFLQATHYTFFFSCASQTRMHQFSYRPRVIGWPKNKSLPNNQVNRTKAANRARFLSQILV